MNRFIAVFLFLTYNLCNAQVITQQNAPLQSIPFIENKGQWEEQVLFKANLPSGAIYAEKDGWVYSFYDDAPLKAYFSKWHSIDFDASDPKHAFTLNSHSFRVRFQGASVSARPDPEQPRSYYFNYFLGNDRTQWASGARAFESLYYTDMYPLTDLRLYKMNLGVKYDLLLHPGADIKKIRMRISGADSIWLDDGKCYVKTSVNTVVEQRPYAYQKINDALRQVECEFVLEGKDLGFQIHGNYDPRHTLVIDPLLIFSTYSGSTADNFGHTATYDSEGHLYAGGITSENLGGTYRTDSGSFQQFFGGGVGGFPCDASISKYSKNGDSLLYATYLGGAGNDHPHSLVCDHDDNLVIMGSTNSHDYPVSLHGYDTSYNLSEDIIITKFSKDGKQLIGSTYVGGKSIDGQNTRSATKFNYADDFRGDIIYDSENNYYIASCTQSDSFPVTAGAIQKTYGGFQDGVVFKINSDLSSLLWSTYVGGAQTDALYSIRLNDDEEIFVGGGTSSTDFKTTPTAIQPAFSGGRADGVVLHLNHGGDTLIASTYVGTPAYDQVYFVDVDKANNVYMTGQTAGQFAIIPSTVYNMPGSGQFILKVTKNLDTINVSTAFGTGVNGPDISPSAFLVDNCDNIYISGWGGSINTGHNTSLLPVTLNALQDTSDGEDFYLAVFSRNVNALLYATYYGGNLSGDHVDGGTSRFDRKGIIYQSVCSSCPPGANPISDFPTSPNAVFKNNVSPRCSNASFKIDLQIGNPIDADFVPLPNKGCVPLLVNFQNKSYGGVSQIWDFGDGSSKDTARNPSHTFIKTGVFNVKLILIDSASCSITDSISRQVSVLPEPKADFSYSYDACSGELEFKNLSKDAVTSDWDFGDGSKDTAYTPIHPYASTGSYKVKLVVNKSYFCLDSIEKTVSLSADSLKKIVIPNVFTPNQDGLNDEWQAGGLNPECDTVEMRVYNRWGEILFHSRDVNEKWGGVSQKNFECPSGVYFYIIEIQRKNGDRIKKHGTVTLIRNK